MQSGAQETEVLYHLPSPDDAATVGLEWSPGWRPKTSSSWRGKHCQHLCCLPEECLPVFSLAHWRACIRFPTSVFIPDANALIYWMHYNLKYFRSIHLKGFLSLTLLLFCFDKRLVLVPCNTLTSLWWYSQGPSYFLQSRRICDTTFLHRSGVSIKERFEVWCRCEFSQGCNTYLSNYQLNPSFLRSYNFLCCPWEFKKGA